MTRDNSYESVLFHIQGNRGSFDDALETYVDVKTATLPKRARKGVRREMRRRKQRERVYRRFARWASRQEFDADDERTWLEIFLDWLSDGGFEKLLEWIMKIIGLFA